MTSFKGLLLDKNIVFFFINSEYDQEIPQSKTADNPMAPRGRATKPSRETRKLLLLPLLESVLVLCFVVRYFMSILVLQSF